MKQSRVGSMKSAEGQANLLQHLVSASLCSYVLASVLLVDQSLCGACSHLAEQGLVGTLPAELAKCQHFATL